MLNWPRNCIPVGNGPHTVSRGACLSPLCTTLARAVHQPPGLHVYLIDKLARASCLGVGSDSLVMFHPERVATESFWGRLSGFRANQVH